MYWCAPRRSLKALNLRLRLFFLHLIWTAVFTFPGTALLAATFYSLYETGIEYKTAFSLLAGGAACLAAGLVFAAVTVQRYLLAGFYLALNPRLSVRYAIKKSTAAMEGRCLKALEFKLSFSVWFMLSILIFPAFYVFSYYNRSLSCFKLYIAKSAKA